MSRLGYTIHALVMAPKLMPDEKYVGEMRALVSHLQVIGRQSLRNSLATIAPTGVSRNSTLAGVPVSDQYDLTLVEGEAAFSIYDNPRLRTKLRVLRVHNNEGRYVWELAKVEENPLRRYFQRLEALRYVKFSQSAYRRVDSLWFISRNERDSFVAKHPAAAAKAIWLPPSIIVNEMPKHRRPTSRRVLFVGSLHLPLNREALRWYLKEVHVRLAQDPDYEFVIAGSTQGRSYAQCFAEQIKLERRCSVHLDINDLTPFYDDCAVFVNPMRGGAGVKLKSIHAIQRGIPVVTTSVGNEGNGFVGLDHVMIADTGPEFATAIRLLLDDRGLREGLAARAYRHLITHYNSEANIHKLCTDLVSEKPRGAPVPSAACAQEHRLAFWR